LTGFGDGTWRNGGLKAQKSPTMSAQCPKAKDAPTAPDVDTCAHCGIKSGGEGGKVKLKMCTACRLVKYCSVDCQKAHRMGHKKACKERAAELRDEKLFNQGSERTEEDFCPICFIPYPVQLDSESVFRDCCLKIVCTGCSLAALERKSMDCPFCRTPPGEEGSLERIRGRAEKGDPEAMAALASGYFYGRYDLTVDKHLSFKWWKDAADLGHKLSQFNVGRAYSQGDGVPMDMKVAIHYWEEAAMSGCPRSRHQLAMLDGIAGRTDRALRHLLISCKLGFKESMDMIRQLHKDGSVTREQCKSALVDYLNAQDEVGSPLRIRATMMDRKRSTS